MRVNGTHKSRKARGPCNPGSFFTTSSIGELSYVSSEVDSDGDTKSRMSYVLTGRKTWKTLKENKEAVWPPYIEAILLEALEKYRPTTSRDPKLLLRFPKRNRFISQYILHVTKELRTPKQVGSRLQQLRDTCTDPHILELLTRRSIESAESSYDEKSPNNDSRITLPPSPSSPTSPLSSISEGSDLSAVEEPVNDLFGHRRSLPQRRVQVLPCLDNWFSGLGIESYGPEITCSLGCYQTQVNVTHYEQSLKKLHLQVDIPWDLLDVVPSVTFTSHIPLSPKMYKSLCCPFVNNAFVCPETTELVEVSAPTSPKDNAQYVYGTQLIPEQWLSLVQTTDISTLTILQDYVQVLPENGDAHGETIHEATLFTVVYNFKTSAALLTPPYQPSIVSCEPLFTNFPETPVCEQNSPGYNDGNTNTINSWDSRFIPPQPPCYSPLPVVDHGCYHVPLLQMYDGYGKCY